MRMKDESSTPTFGPRRTTALDAALFQWRAAKGQILAHDPLDTGEPVLDFLLSSLGLSMAVLVKNNLACQMRHSKLVLPRCKILQSTCSLMISFATDRCLSSCI
jgi:hypothetical protein